MAQSSTTESGTDAGGGPMVESFWRNELARTVIRFSFYILFALLGFALFYIWTRPDILEDPTKARNAIDVTTSLIGLILPVLGTWVGTVLAFYFARDNFVAASNAVIKSAGGGEAASLSVRTFMRPFAQIKNVVKLPTDTGADGVFVEDLKNYLKDPMVSRLVILDDSGAVKYVLDEAVVYRDAALFDVKTAKRQEEAESALKKAVESAEKACSEAKTARDAAVNATQEEISAKDKALASAETALTEARGKLEQFQSALKSPAEAAKTRAIWRTLKDLFEDGKKEFGDIEAEAGAIEYVSEYGTLADCQRRMSESKCRNVFVTPGGKSRVAPLGWVTDHDVAERAKA